MRTTLLAAVLLVLSSCLRAQSMAVVVDEGPLVCLSTNGLANANHDVTLHLASIAGDSPARPFWRNRDNANVLARLDRDHLLVASYGTPYALVVVDLGAGTHRVLAEGCPHDFVAVHGDQVLHLGDTRHGANDDFLYATPWRTAGERRRLAEQRFARVPQVVGNLAVGVAIGDTAAWVVSILRGTGRAVWTAPATAEALNVALSPGGQRLAIGCVVAGRGLLSVVDTGSAAVVRSWPDLPIDVSPLSSSRPCLEVGWHDDAVVVCSETRSNQFAFVHRSLDTGDVVTEDRYAFMDLSHEVPPPTTVTAKPAPPAFTTDVVEGVVRLLRVGTNEVLATFVASEQQFGDYRIAPDGQSAIAHRAARKTGCTLFTSEGKSGRLLVDGSAYDVVWLPATAQEHR